MRLWLVPNENTYKKERRCLHDDGDAPALWDFPWGNVLALLLDDHNREFIQEIQRYEHKHKREGVATGSDDCCKYHQTHNGMTPIFAQELLVEDAEL